MPHRDRSTTHTAAQLAGVAFRQYAPELHRYLRRRVRCPQDADDLAQEVFMRFLRSDQIELVRNPQSYLFGIASHVVREFHLKAEHEQQRLSYDTEAAEQAAEHPATVAPDELTDALSLRQELERLLSKLPPMHRAVLLLVKRDGLSHEEAAQATGLSVHTVEKYIVEARAKLRTLKWDR